MALFWGCNFLKQGPAFVFWIEADTLGDYYYYYYYFAHVLSILRLALRHIGYPCATRVPSTDRHNRHNSLLLLSSKSNDSFHPSTSSEKFLLKKKGGRGQDFNLKNNNKLIHSTNPSHNSEVV